MQHSTVYGFCRNRNGIIGGNVSARSPPVNLPLMDHHPPPSSGQPAAPITTSAPGVGGCMVKCVSPAKNLAPRNRSHQHQNALANRNGGSASQCHNHLETSALNNISNSRNTSPRSSTAAPSINSHNNNIVNITNNSYHQQSAAVAHSSSNINGGPSRSTGSPGAVTASQNQIVPVVYSTASAAAANQNVPFFTNLSVHSSVPVPQPSAPDDAINSSSMTSLSTDVQQQQQHISSSPT